MSSHSPVVVNFNVEVDASGSITVFGQPIISMSNVIVADTTLPVNALYDEVGLSNNQLDNSLFEFWEPSEAIGNISAILAGSDTNDGSEGRDYTKMVKKLVRDFQSILEGYFDCSGATPFNDNKYTSTQQYYRHNNFGRVALSAYAHYLFGHVAATAAITNDQTFIESVMSWSTGTTNYKINNVSDIVINNDSSTMDANIASRIVYAITNKNPSAVLEIVNQVIGQDASRAMDKDNNQLAPNKRQALRFYEGDVIYVNVHMKQPNVSYGANNYQSYTIDASGVDEMKYSLKITLEDKQGASFPETPESAPVISYTSNSQTFTRATAITSLSPSNTGGAISSYSISPNITSDTGLSFNTTTGVISGTPSTVKSATAYTVTATGSTGATSTYTITVTVLEPSPVISYTSNSQTFTRATAITSLSPSNTGGAISSYSISPNITSDTGLSFNTATGVISGTPSTVKSATAYTVTATGSTGATSTYTITVTVLEPSPVISYTYNRQTFTLTNAITSMSPSNTGGAISSYSISPDITSDTGLSFDTTTGIISGTPTTLKSGTNYIITATGITGSTSDYTILIEIVESFKYRWLRWIDGIGADRGLGVTSDDNGNVYISGTADNSLSILVDASGSIISAPAKPTVGATTDGVFVAKYDTAGTYQWLRWIDSSGVDQGMSITSDASANIYVTGYAANSLTITTDQSGTTMSAPTKPDRTTYGGFIAKYNTSGTYQWLRWIDGSGVDQGMAIKSDLNNNIYVSGCASNTLRLTTDQSGNTISAPTKSGGQTYGGFVAKYDTNGTYQWLRWIDGNGIDQGTGLTSDPSGNVYVTGYASNSLTLTSQGGTAISAPTKPDGSTSDGGFVAKYNTNGTYQWLRWIDGSGVDQGLSIASDILGNVYVTGKSTTSLRLSTDQSGNTVAAPAKPDATTYGGFVAKYNTSGTYQWLRWIDGSGTDYGYGIASEASGNIFVTGLTTQSLMLTTNQSGTIISASPNKPASGGSTNAVFILKYDQNGDYKDLRWIDGSGNDQANGITVNNIGNMYLTGTATNRLITTIDNTGTIQGVPVKPTIGGTTEGAFIVKYNT